MFSARLAVATLMLAAQPAIGALAEETRHTPVPLVQSGRGWILDARVNDAVTGRFLLDTGATSCVITPLMADRLGLPPPTRQIEMNTAAGLIHAGVVRLERVTVGASTATRVHALILDAIEDDLDGVIGLNFLDRFSYTIDPRRGLLDLR